MSSKGQERLFKSDNWYQKTWLAVSRMNWDNVTIPSRSCRWNALRRGWTCASSRWPRRRRWWLWGRRRRRRKRRRPTRTRSGRACPKGWNWAEMVPSWVLIPLVRSQAATEYAFWMKTLISIIHSPLGIFNPQLAVYWAISSCKGRAILKKLITQCKVYLTHYICFHIASVKNNYNILGTVPREIK